MSEEGPEKSIVQNREGLLREGSLGRRETINKFLEKNGMPGEVKALEKSIVTKIVLQPGLGLFSFEMD